MGTRITGWVVLLAALSTSLFGCATGDSAATLELAVTLEKEPPARLLAPRPHLPPPHLPVAIGPPPAPPAALVFRAPLGYRITAVRDVSGAATGVIQNGGRRVVLRPSTAAGGIRVELHGAADPRFSTATTRARQEQHLR